MPEKGAFSLGLVVALEDDPVGVYQPNLPRVC